MSIAVSVQVKPSRLLRALFGLLLLVVALLPLWLMLAQDRAGARQWDGALACGLWLACIAAWFQARGLWLVRELEFTRDGQLFLHGLRDGRQKVVILPGSTIWSWCLVLRLQCVTLEGQMAATRLVVVAMPDSVSAVQMRALQVACRWQQARHIDAGVQKNL